MNILEQLKTLSSERAEIISKQNEIFKQKAHEVFKELFIKYPTLEEFSWTQYTPYFNDGDECTFSVNCDYPLVMFKGMEERVDCDEYYFDRWDNELRKRVENTEEDKAQILEVFKNPQSLVEEVRELIIDILSNIPDEVMRDMFGEGEIIVRIDGIETEDYDHD